MKHTTFGKYIILFHRVRKILGTTNSLNAKTQKHCVFLIFLNNYIKWKRNISFQPLATNTRKNCGKSNPCAAMRITSRKKKTKRKQRNEKKNWVQNAPKKCDVFEKCHKRCIKNNRLLRDGIKNNCLICDERRINCICGERPISCVCGTVSNN